MQTTIKLSAFLLAVICFAGCVEVQNKNQETAPAAIQAQRVQDQMDISGDVELTPHQLKAMGAVPSEIQRGFWVLEARTLQFLPGARIRTLGTNIIFKAETIRALGSLDIETFAETVEAPQGQVGRSGGEIHLESENIEGHFEFYFRGEKGGQGLPGKEPDKSLNGANATTRGPDGDCHFEADFFGNNRTIVCKSPQRYAGQSGKQGYPGQPGLNGGDAGRLVINALQTRNFSCRIQANVPGEGGAGGEGGQGGQQGQDGPAGTVILHPDMQRELDTGNYQVRAELSKYRNGNDWVFTYPTIGTPATAGPQGPTGKSGQQGNPVDVPSICSGL